MTRDEILTMLRDSLGAVLRERHSKGRLLVPTGTLDGLIDELTRNASAPIVMTHDLEAAAEYEAVTVELDRAGMARTRDGISDAYEIHERIRLLAMQRNEAEAANVRLKAGLQAMSDAAHLVLEAFDNGEVDVNHPSDEDDIECPEDDTCKCLGPAAINQLSSAHTAALKTIKEH